MNVKRKTINHVTRILSIVILMSILVPTAFATNYNQPGSSTGQMRYKRISVFAIELTISTSGKASCYSWAESAYSTDTIDLTMELQRYIGGTWDTVKSWNGSGTAIAYLNKDWYITSGYNYRVLATAKVYNSSGVLQETVPEPSRIVYY